MLRKILLVGEALARKGEAPEFFSSDEDFAKEIGRSEYAVWCAKPVLRQLGIATSIRRGDEAVTVARKGFRTHYLLSDAPRSADYAGNDNGALATDDSNERFDTPPERRRRHDEPPPPPREEPPPPSREALQRYYDANFKMPPEAELPAYRDVVMNLPQDDDLLDFGMAIMIPEIAAQLTLVRCEVGQAKRTMLKRLLGAFDFDHPERLADLGAAFALGLRPAILTASPSTGHSSRAHSRDRRIMLGPTIGYERTNNRVRKAHLGVR